jgi:hypothetical protein
MKTFDVVHYDGAVKVTIDEEGYAILDVSGIKSREVLVRAINQAHLAGAKRATMFTNETVNDQIARMNIMRWETGTTFLDGRVTRLDENEESPRFRIDWDELPFIN